LNLNIREIATMLNVYSEEKSIEMNIAEISEKLHYYTSGYPFLTSYLCEIIDEEFLPLRENKTWQIEDVDAAFKIILEKQNTNFQTIIKNLENNTELYNLVSDMLIGAEEYSYNEDDPLVDWGITYGIFRKKNNKTVIHNHIYEQRIYNYMISKTKTSHRIPTFEGKFVINGVLDVRSLLLGFQRFMQENHSQKNERFLEKQGTLLFLAYTKPVINGKGFDFKEVQISEERRLDVVITYLNQKYVIELKQWRGEEAHKDGLNQLSDYLDRQNLQQGYLLIYDFRIKDKEYKHLEINYKDKNIFAVWV